MTVSGDKPNLGHNTKKSDIFLFILLLIVILGVSFMVYLKSQNVDLSNINLKDFFSSGLISKGDTSEVVSEIKFEANERPAFTSYDGLLIKCTKDYVTGLDDKGNEQWSLPITVGSPVLKTAGSYLLIADITGKDVYVVRGRSIKWEKRMDTNILNADISENGYTAVVREVKGYKGEVEVFDHNGDPIFKRTMVDNFILQAKISPNNKQMTINSIDTSGIKATSNFKFTDMLGTVLTEKTPEEGIILPSMWVLDNGDLATVNDFEVIYLDEAAKEIWRKEFKNRKIYSSNIVLGKYTVIAVSSESPSGAINNNKTDVIIYNKSGEQISTYSVEDKVFNLETYSDFIGINTGREVNVINTKGKLAGKTSSKTDITGFYFLNKQEIAMVTKSKVIVSKF